MNRKKTLLTLAIPSYNRADKLDKQIAWAVGCIGENWQDCELLIADNCSSDNTDKVCLKWKGKLGDKISIIRNEKNLGLIGNYITCINKAKGDFLWAVSDDDPISYESVNNILGVLKKHDISFLHLNHRCLDENNNRILFDNFYRLDKDIFDQDGKKILEYLIDRTDFGGVMFITANVGRTDLLREAVKALPNATNNLGFTIFISGYLASKGAVYFSSKLYCDCMYGKSSWLNHAIWLHLVDIPLVFSSLEKMGYNKQLIHKQLKWCQSWYNWRDVIKYAVKYRKAIIPKAIYAMSLNNIFLKRI